MTKFSFLGGEPSLKSSMTQWCQILQKHFKHVDKLTSIFRELPPINLILHHIRPIEGALVEMEVQGNRVPQTRYQHAELSLIQIDAADLMAV